ncbi:hypothetical protein CBR_g45356 [Chara braunii]|uniref:Protein kinase domain-containing protein n=1 Tax=Chara braunii TaxID=69332 RepID=A0A388LYA6_CHABU|nr:hypothetical protein CBR_g45356 [Chara braunii]|eukprot:GBG87297.1 hypothetical protein CBR_g45356 [Chara braunii]
MAAVSVGRIVGPVVVGSPRPVAGCTRDSPSAKDLTTTVVGFADHSSKEMPFKDSDQFRRSDRSLAGDPSLAPFSLLNADLFAPGTGKVILIHQAEPPFEPATSSSYETRSVIRSIVFVPNSTIFYYILDQRRLVVGSETMSHQSVSYRKGDLLPIREGGGNPGGNDSLIVPELISYWWPYDTPDGIGISTRVLFNASENATDLALVYGMEITGSGSRLVLPTVRREPNHLPEPSRLTFLSVGDGSRNSTILPAADRLFYLSYNPAKTDLFMIDKQKPARLLSIPVDDDGLPVNTSALTIVKTFLLSSGSDSPAQIYMSRQCFVSDGRCLYFREETRGQIYAIDTRSASRQITHIAGRPGSDPLGDGPALNASFADLREMVATPDGCNIFVTELEGYVRWIKLNATCQAGGMVETVARHNSARLWGLALHRYAGRLFLYVGSVDGRIFELEIQESHLHTCVSPSPSSPLPPPPSSSSSTSSPSPDSSVFFPPPSSHTLSPSPSEEAILSPAAPSIPVVHPAPDDGNQSSSSGLAHNLPFVIGLSLGAVVIAAAIFGVVLARYCRQERRSRPSVANQHQRQSSSVSMTTDGTGTQPSGASLLGSRSEDDRDLQPTQVVRFSLKELSRCCGNFDDSRLVGDAGAFGQVYRGVIEGTEVALKVMTSDLTAIKKKQFRAEVNTLSMLNHHNLIRLKGYCQEKNRAILVYPYVAGGSLHARLHKRENAIPGQPTPPPLSLMDRMLLALHIAEGLRYLHEGARPPVIHRDIKSSNVLIEDGPSGKLHAVLADFGLAKIGSEIFGTSHQQHVQTSHIAGTFGYMAPEYMLDGRLSVKNDVFAFGVMILELLTGRKAVTKTSSGVGWVPLVEWVRPFVDQQSSSLFGPGMPDAILDPCLKDRWVLTAAERQMAMEMLRLGLDSAHERDVMRPTMGEVVDAIRNIWRQDESEGEGYKWYCANRVEGQGFKKQSEDGDLLSVSAVLPSLISAGRRWLELQVQAAATVTPSAASSRCPPKLDDIPVFCDKSKTELIPWWRQFTLRLDMHHVPNNDRHPCLFHRSGGACQAWLDNILTSHGVAVSELHTKLTWQELTDAWHKRFQVEPPDLQAMDKLNKLHQNTLLSQDWITEFQRLACTPDLPLAFRAIKYLFIMHSCLALQNALTQIAETLDTSHKIFSTASRIILTNIEALNAGRSSATTSGTQLKPKVHWVERLLDVELTYNSSIHPAIGISPIKFEHGSPISSSLDAILPRTTESDDHLAFLRRMQELLVKARDQMSKTQIRMSRQANRNRLPCPFRAGDLVWVSAAEFSLEQDISRKLLPKWMGPWRILSAVGDDPEGPSFRIAVPPQLPVHTVFHCSKLAPFVSAESDEFPDRRTQDPPSMDGFEEAGYIITDRRHGNKETEFLLHFSYCSHKANRWLTRSLLQTTTPAVLSHYLSEGKTTPSTPAPRIPRYIPPLDRQLRPRPGSSS